jgi:hypothetical protein
MIARAAALRRQLEQRRRLILKKARWSDPSASPVRPQGTAPSELANEHDQGWERSGTGQRPEFRPEHWFEEREGQLVARHPWGGGTIRGVSR